MISLQPDLIGIDDGYAAIKVAHLSGGQIKTFAIRSMATLADQARSVNGKPPFEAYETGGVRLLVSEYGATIDTRFDDYPVSDLNRVLVHHAMRMAGLGGRDVRIATALPAMEYFSSEVPAKEKAASLNRLVTPMDGGAPARIVHQEVAAQGLAAFFDWALDDEGRAVNGVTRPVSVIDIGGRTTDIVSLLPGRDGPILQSEATGSLHAGVMELEDFVRARVREVFHIEGAALRDLGEAIRTRKIVYRGKDIDIAEFVEAGIASVHSKIEAFIQSKIKTGVEYDTILVVGGGAEIFGEVLQAERGAVIPNQPAFANSRGLLKFLRARFSTAERRVA